MRRRVIGSNQQKWDCDCVAVIFCCRGGNRDETLQYCWEVDLDGTEV